VSAAEIDAYLETVPALQREVLSVLAREFWTQFLSRKRDLVRVPAFRVEGAVVAGFASFTNHMSYLPFSGSVLLNF